MTTNNTLAAVFLDGLAGELSYMTTDEQAEALDRADYLQCCDEDEIADAAEFTALAVRLARRLVSLWRPLGAWPCDSGTDTMNSVNPNDRAIQLARLNHVDGAERQACVLALAQVPECRWSPDQLKARAFNPTCKDMFWSFGSTKETHD